MVATVLTACGIETAMKSSYIDFTTSVVATVLTACGIETLMRIHILNDASKLQQYLPLAVLKPQLQLLLQLP